MRGRLQDALPNIVLAPSFVITIIFVYGFIVWTASLSFTNSKTFPVLCADRARAPISGCGAGPSRAIRRPPGIPRSPTWRSSASSISASAWRSACSSPSCSTRRSAARACCGRSILYPMALSFIVTGTAWKWFLNPGLGLEKTLHHFGWDELPLRLDQEQGLRHLHRRHRRRLAGLGLRHGDVPGGPARHRRRDHEGRADRWRLSLPLYRRIVIPLLRPVFLSAFIVLPIWRSSPTTSWWR